MLRSIKFHIILVLVVFALAACSPTAIAYSTGTKPTVMSSTEEPIQAATAAPTPIATTVNLPQLKVHDVQMQIGVGSPIPVDAFISGELPDTCAQLAEVKLTQKDFTFVLTLTVTPGTRAECQRDTLPFRIAVPLNLVNAPQGTYTVKANAASTTFQWPSEPTGTSDPAMTVPAEWETYRNDTLHFEIDYPQGWIVEHSGDLDILWSEKLSGPGRDGVPNNVVKIDIVTEPNTTMTLDQLVAQQKQIVTSDNGKVLLEEPFTLESGVSAVRLGVSGMADSLSLLTVIKGHPVMLVGYGDLSRFDEVARTLRTVEP